MAIGRHKLEKRSRRQREPYIAIMHAAALGRGISLTADEVATLSMDDAIETHAANCLAVEEFEARVDRGLQWEDIDPYAKREPGDCFTGSGER